MIPLKAERIKIRLGNLWETPVLHVLLTQEDDVIVARCLDFTVSSHGENEEDAIESLGYAIREYILSAAEDNVIDTAFDPAYDKYWKMYRDSACLVKAPREHYKYSLIGTIENSPAIHCRIRR